MRIVQSALFLTVLFVSSQPFAAAGVLDKFKNKEGQRQQAEANVNADQYEMDASTGTVRKLPAEEQEQLKDLSCDSQMAKSLVKANDDLLQAQNERDAALQAKADAEQQIEALEKALAAKKEAMKAKVDDLNEKLVMSSNKAMNQMKDMSKAHDATIKDYERRLRATAQEYEEKLTATVSSSGDQLKELIAEKNAELVALKEETDATIASLQATIDEFQTTAEAEKKQIAGESQKKVDDLQQQMKKVQSEKSALEASKKDTERKVQQMSEVSGLPYEKGPIEATKSSHLHLYNTTQYNTSVDILSSILYFTYLYILFHRNLRLGKPNSKLDRIAMSHTFRRTSRLLPTRHRRPQRKRLPKFPFKQEKRHENFRKKESRLPRLDSKSPNSWLPTVWKRLDQPMNRRSNLTSTRSRQQQPRILKRFESLQHLMSKRSQPFPNHM